MYEVDTSSIIKERNYGMTGSSVPPSRVGSDSNDTVSRSVVRGALILDKIIDSRHSSIDPSTLVFRVSSRVFLCHGHLGIPV